MLSALCHEIKNWFETEKLFGDFVIEDGTLTLEKAQEGQYFRIVGSVFNDGVYQYPALNLSDEVFNGAIWLMAVPKEVIDLSNEIDEWNSLYGGVDSALMSPYNSESFGGYSYSKSGGGSSDGTNKAGTWQGVFASRLNQWRKIR
jgi:hypothetical protein